MVKTALPSGKVVLIDKAKVPLQSVPEMKQVSQTTLEVVRPKKPQSEAQKANTLRLVALAKQRALERRGITEIDQNNIPSKDQIPEDKELVYIKTKKASTRKVPDAPMSKIKEEHMQMKVEPTYPFPPPPKLERQDGYYPYQNERSVHGPQGMYYPYQNERAVQPFYPQYGYNMPPPPQYIPVPVPVKKQKSEATRSKKQSKKSKTYYDTSEADTEDTEQETEPDTDYEIEKLQKKIEKKASVVERLNNIQSQPQKLKNSGVF
jgi:hypothetical protein